MCQFSVVGDFDVVNRKRERRDDGRKEDSRRSCILIPCVFGLFLQSEEEFACNSAERMKERDFGRRRRTTRGSGKNRDKREERFPALRSFDLLVGLEREFVTLDQEE